MKNRESLYPGRVKITPVDAANGIYDLIRADEPQEEGTPLNKKLLDYAVAACGVTAGTATALTLDDEFGGFELVDGAKVNFRLHVASGVNPTLNVNGTGAKRIVDTQGGAIMAGIPQGTWITATYSLLRDSYGVSSPGGWTLLSATKLNTNANAVTVPLTSGYNAYRLSCAIRTVDAVYQSLDMSADNGASVYGVYARIENANLQSFDRTTTGSVKIFGSSFVFISAMIVRYESYNGFSAIVTGDSGIGMISSANSSKEIKSITIAGGLTLRPGSTISLEGIV